MASTRQHRRHPGGIKGAGVRLPDQDEIAARRYNMTEMNKRGFRCAIYTRVSTDLGLEQDVNSLDAQRDASEAYIKSQAHEGCDRFGISTTTVAIRVG